MHCTGTGPLTYQQALAACLVEGGIFLLLVLLGLHSKIIAAVPPCIKLATAGGIGVFLAVIGLQQGFGLGLLSVSGTTRFRGVEAATPYLCICPD